MNLLLLAGNAIWILGISIIVGGIGWRLWQYRNYPISPNDTPIVIVLDIGALIICLGISISVDRPWARILFALLAGTFAIIASLDLRKSSRVQL